MNKKSYKENQGNFSYMQNRSCRYCKAPIHDKAHSSQEFCPKTYDANGKVRDCKTTYHRENDKPEREKQAEYNARNKALKTRIEFLLKKEGEQVTTEMLDTYEIELNACMKYEISPAGILTSYFLNYQIVSNPSNNIHKIKHHE
jgi:hypothetical protein